MPRTGWISRVEFFCHDEKVGDALRGLMGIAVGQPTVQPVTNVNVKGNRLAAKSNGRAIDQLSQYLREKKLKEITRETMREFMQSIGAADASRNYVLTQAIEQKLIKRDPKSTNNAARWIVLPQRSK